MGVKILNRTTYHAVYDESILAALHYAQENDFAGVQVADETLHLSFEHLSERDVTEIRNFLDTNEIRMSLHALDDTTSLFVPSPILREGIHAYYHALFTFAHAVNAQIVTIHMGSMTAFPTDTVPERKYPEHDLPISTEIVRRSLDRLVEEASGRFTLCVENYQLEPSAFELLEPYIAEDKLFLCWDIAKSYGKPELEDYFWSHMKAVKQVHLHDIRTVDGRLRSHRVIGTGEIDFARYLKLLQEADVLDYCIEVRPREKAVESLRALRLILQSVKVNAEHL